MPRGQQDTSAGMVADYEAMLDFVNSMRTMANKLTENRDEVNAALVKMGDLGNRDETCQRFIEGFHTNAAQIDALNDILGTTSKHYERLADLVKQETETDVSVNVSYRRRR